MMIEEGRVFKYLPALKRWLQAFAVIRKRPYKVLHSYAQCRYTVVCDKERCPWRVCARKQNIIGKWKITKVVGPHNCAGQELTVRHRQLTSTLIAKWMMGILKEQPNMKVRTIIRTVAEIYGGYVITYGKAWRAKQRAWKMIYGDWESGYEQLPVLFNAIKAVNPDMHYKYIPKPNAWKDGRQIFGREFWCFPQCMEAFRHYHPVFSIDGTFLIGKYRGTLLIVISYDANNMLVTLAFALVERENNDSWGWFLRLVRIHVVGPGREVGVICDMHQGILHAMQEQIEGYPPLHHRWCTWHLREPTSEGCQWLAGLMRDLDKWTRSHDAGGWWYEFQCYNMVESFNKLLLGIRGMLVNAIVQFIFYRLVAWFNERQAKAEVLQRTYQVEHRGRITSDGEIRESRIHVVVLRDFKCTCGKPRQYHFVCSHLVIAARHRNFDIESMIPHEFSVDTLVHTWSPCFVPFRDSREWPPYDGPKYIVDPVYHWNKRGSRKRTRHNMTMDQVSGRTRRGRATPFLPDPEQHEMAEFHLLDQAYDQTHRGRLVVGGGNICVKCRWRPETHSFHLPFGEMTVTLQDCQKMLGLSIRGNAVTGPCVSEDATGDTASWMWIHCLTDWQQAGQYSWGSAVLCFLYQQLCEACRRTSASVSVGGCMYLLQIWMWPHLPVGHPKVMGRRPWFPDWQQYEGEGVLPFAVSVMCASDDDLYRMKCPLVCFYAVEFHMPDQVARQFGIRQIWPTHAISTRVELHK
uniref:SWIM-type domain-containing protein n=1 Tax=Setaria italica TaxID=4555 RepID=K3ZEI7_SETIT